MKKPAILFRKSLAEEEEFLSAHKYFGYPIVEQRTNIPEGSLVIGRYSVLPYYSELEQDLYTRGSALVNSIHAHNIIANVYRWYGTFADVTPKTWESWEGLERIPCSFVLKGKTNSRKHQWDTHMFAETYKDIGIVANRLLDDSFIRDQGLVIREYIPLEQFDIGIGGVPITNEWRFFFYFGRLVDYGYYWSNFPEHEPKNGPGTEAIEFAIRCNKRLYNQSPGINFFVLDIAKTQEGKWILIEVNDGQMSGLSSIPPDRFYENLHAVVSETFIANCIREEPCLND